MNDEFIEVKVYSTPIYPSKAEQIVAQKVKGVICGGEISDSSKEIFNKNSIWYRENVEPSDLESEKPETEEED